MNLPLLPAPAPPPRWCRCCGRRVPVGPLIDGRGLKCARKAGLVPVAPPRLPAPVGWEQEGPDLLDELAAVPAGRPER